MFMDTILLKNATIINEGEKFEGEILISEGKISQISRNREIHLPANRVIDCKGLWVMPGVIDDQVHFREPGFPHKADLTTESHAAVAGGTTTFMEMPNTNPPALTQTLLEEKYQRAAVVSPANYSFFMGVSNENAAEVLKTNPLNVCGVKIFMGSSTGNMLVDDENTLSTLFRDCELLIATHCEDEETVRNNQQVYHEKYGDSLDASFHPIIRDVEACYKSSHMAIELAKKYNTRLHILHISTEKETWLFDNKIPLEKKRITSEVCVHHLSFDSGDYASLGNKIKCNPAIKSPDDQKALWNALNDDHLDIIATDHAPHTLDEKSQIYLKAPAGLPLVQHGLQLMIDHVKNGRISLERMVHKMCHAPAICFQIKDRGFIREGYWADLVLVDPNKPYQVSTENILYKCGWSPFEDRSFSSSIHSTIVSGNLVWQNGKFVDDSKGHRILFNR
jgi:dihydroorotase